MNPEQPSLEGAQAINAAAQQLIAPVAMQLVNTATMPVQMGNQVVVAVGGALKRRASSIGTNAGKKLAPVQAALGTSLAPAPVQPTPTGGTYPALVAQYNLYINCGNSQLQAFPRSFDPGAAAAAGWTLVEGVSFQTVGAAIAYGQSHLQEILASQCPPAGVIPQPLPSAPSTPTAPTPTPPAPAPTTPGAPTRGAAGGSVGTAAGVTYHLWGSCGPGPGTPTAQWFAGAPPVADTANIPGYHDTGQTYTIAGQIATPDDLDAMASMLNAWLSACVQAPPSSGPAPPPQPTPTPPGNAAGPGTVIIVPPEPAPTPAPPEQPPAPACPAEPVSCPTPGPTGFPPCPVKSPPAPPALPTGAWCEKWQAFVDYLTQVGADILTLLSTQTAPHSILSSYIYNMMVDLCGLSSKSLSEVPNFDKFISDENACSILERWINAALSVLPQASARVQNVIAVKAVLVGLSSVSLSTGASDSKGSSVTGSIGGSVGLASGGIGGGAQHGGNASVAWSVHPVLVPVIELIDQAIRYLAPTGLPGIGEAIDLYTHGRIDLPTLQCWIAINGGRWDAYKTVVDASSYRLSSNDTVLFGRLNGLSPLAVSQALALTGYADPQQNAAFLALYDRPLTPQECLAGAQTGWTGLTATAQYGYLDGFNERLWSKFGPVLTAHGITESVAQLQWVSHWLFPAPQQLAQLVYRSDNGNDPNVIPTTWNDFNTLGFNQGYNTWSLDRLRELSRPLPGIRQLTIGVTTDQFTRDDALTLMHKQGYAAPWDQKLADTYWYLGRRRAASAAGAWTLKSAVEALYTGQVTLEQATALVSDQGYGQGDVSAALQVYSATVIARQTLQWTRRALSSYANQVTHGYTLGVIDRATAQAGLLQAGATTDSANLLLDTADISSQFTIARSGLSAVRRSLLSGAITYQQAITALSALGIQPPRAQQYATQWSAELTFARRAASRADIVNWTADGRLPLVAARQRLANLGYSADDIALIVADIQAKAAKAASAAAAAKAKQGMAAAKAAAQAAKQAQQAIASAQRTVRAFWSLGRSIKLYAIHQITEATFRTKLKQGGYSDEEVNSAFAEAQLARQKADKQSAKSGPAGIELTNGAGV